MLHEYIVECVPEGNIWAISRHPATSSVLLVFRYYDYDKSLQCVIFQNENGYMVHAVL